jgi:Flp pilus assembly pilin Flp
MPFIPSKQETGQGLVEYTLVFVLVGIAVIAGLMLFGPSIGRTFSTINSSLPEMSIGGIPVVINPTSASTIAPTITPTTDPDAVPTDEPTMEPTIAPTQTPTTAPTLAPTIAPTIEPTLEPTIAPTIEPTPTEQPWWCVYWPQFCQ